MEVVVSDKFVVLVTGTTTLSKSEVWPDGNAPVNPTAKDVAEVMVEAGRFAVIHDWCLDEDLSVEIYADTSYAHVFSPNRVSAEAAS